MPRSAPHVTRTTARIAGRLRACGLDFLASFSHFAFGSAKALKRRREMPVLGNLPSSPPSAYLKGRR